MSVTSGFFNSLNGDRRYTAEQFSELMDGLINDGVFANIGSAFAVNAATGNGITIGIGRAWFNGTWLYNDAVLPMNVRASEVLVDRIDALVIEINRSDAVRAGNIMFVYGEPSSTPVRPTLTNTDEIHQYPLAYIYRSAGATSVSQADIENMVGTSACPFVTGILEVVDVDQLLTQWNTQFGNWFDNLQITLSGDVAANLANQILELQSQFDTLAKEKAVYSVLFDSSGEAIRDNNNGEIMGKTVVGGDGNSTINVEGDSYQIGDTLTTARTDLDERWLLCNGETISEGQYPYLFPLLSQDIINRTVEYADDISENISSGILDTFFYEAPYYITYSTTVVRYCTDFQNGSWTDVSCGITTIGNVQKVNGYWIISGKGATYPCFYYSENIGGPYTLVDLTGDVGRNAHVCKGVWFVDGYWLAYTYLKGTNDYSGFGYSSTIDGPYEDAITDESYYGNPVGNIYTVYSYGGYIVAVGGIRRFRLDFRAITEGDTSYQWSYSNVAEVYGGDGSVINVKTVNDYMAHLATYTYFHSSSNAELATAGLFFYQNFDSSAYSEILRIAGGIAIANITDITYIDPYYIACGFYSVDTAQSGYDTKLILAFSNSLGGPWTVKTIDSRVGSSSTFSNLFLYFLPVDSTMSVVSFGNGFQGRWYLSEDKVDLPAISRELYTYIKAQE